MGEFHGIGSIDDISLGKSKVVELQNKKIAIFHIADGFYALDNTCPHRQGPLGEGTLDGQIVSCPWHGWRFDLKTGACIANPSAKVSTYPTKIENNTLFIEL
jgi:nitrite reductase (NADH) small subunit